MLKIEDCIVSLQFFTKKTIARIQKSNFYKYVRNFKKQNQFCLCYHNVNKKQKMFERNLAN
jgi:hypothetical protein